MRILNRFEKSSFQELILLASLMFLSATSLLAYGGDRENAFEAYEREDFAKALELSLKLENPDDGNMLANIGNMYGFGWGTEVNSVKAVSYWEKAANRHVGAAMGNLGFCYYKGECGLPVDYAKAAEWYLKAAEHKHIPSMLTLSGLYATGRGVDKNTSKALAWVGLALSNVNNPKVEQFARYQLKQTANGATEKDMQEGQKLMYEYAKVIDANQALYQADNQFFTSTYIEAKPRIKFETDVVSKP